MALARVAARVAQGGHNVLEATVRRRFALGLRNLRQIYQPLVDSWLLYDNASTPPELLAEGKRS
jgi:predicted ABC-type ATPase